MKLQCLTSSGPGIFSSVFTSISNIVLVFAILPDIFGLNSISVGGVVNTIQHNYALSCRDDRNSTLTCMKGPHSYYCDSQGRLQHDPGWAHRWCEKECKCVNLSPTPAVVIPTALHSADYALSEVSTFIVQKSGNAIRHFHKLPPESKVRDISPRADGNSDRVLFWEITTGCYTLNAALPINNCSRRSNVKTIKFHTMGYNSNTQPPKPVQLVCSRYVPIAESINIPSATLGTNVLPRMSTHHSTAPSASPSTRLNLSPLSTPTVRMKVVSKVTYTGNESKSDFSEQSNYAINCNYDRILTNTCMTSIGYYCTNKGMLKRIEKALDMSQQFTSHECKSKCTCTKIASMAQTGFGSAVAGGGGGGGVKVRDKTSAK